MQNNNLDSCAILTEATAHVSPPAQDIEFNSMPESCLEALSLLEKSLHCLKIDVPTELDDAASPGGAEFEVNASAGPYSGEETEAFEEGPTPSEAELHQEVAVSLLDVEETMESSSYYTVLDWNLRRLLHEEKKSKAPSVKAILELTIVSDYNVLRETLRRQGCRSPSTTASLQIARCKAAGPFKGTLRTKGVWYVRQLCRKAAHIMNLGFLPSSRQGQGATHHTLLCNEDVWQGINAYLIAQQVGQVSAKVLGYPITHTFTDNTKDSPARGEPEYPPRIRHPIANQRVHSTTMGEEARL